MLGPVPLDFILFACVLLGIALFHHYTFQVAVSGLVVIALYKALVTGTPYGMGIAGVAGVFGHEWITLVNLFCLLMGFALLSKHFEDSHVPEVLPRYLPDGWKGGFVLLILVFVLSSFLDNIAAALIGGTMAAAVFRGKVHIGYLAAIVAASNAGGSGSVVGDTTTTMMWIDGVNPLEVLDAYIAAVVALFVFGIIAARQQHAHAPINREVKEGIRIDWARVWIVAFILVTAITANVVANVWFPVAIDNFPVIGVGGRRRDPRFGARAQAGLGAAAREPQGHDLPALPGVVRRHDAGGEAAPGFLAEHVESRLHFRRLRQHPAHGAGPEPGRLRLGHARLRGRFRGFDDLVRFVGRGGAVQPVPGGALRRPVAAPRLARGGGLRDRLPRAADGPRLAPGTETGQGATGSAAADPAAPALKPMRSPRLVLALAALAAFGAGEAVAAGTAAAGQTFLWLAVIIFLARLSSFVEKVGIPGVLGELVMGVILGNLSLFGSSFSTRSARTPRLPSSPSWAW